MNSYHTETMGSFRPIFSPHNITDLASIRIAECLYSRTEVKDFIKISSKTPDGIRYGFSSRQTYYSKSFGLPSNPLYQRVKQLQIPVTLQDKVMDVIKTMALNMSDWIVWVRRYIDPETKMEHYVDHIKWTYDGRVNGSATIRSMYNANLFSKGYNSFIVLSQFCLEDLLQKEWPNSTSPYILCSSTWLKKSFRCLNAPSTEPVDPLKMFLNSIENGNSTASRFLWFHLNDMQRMVATDMMWRTIFHSNIKMIIHEKPIDALVFLWQQLSDEDSRKLFKMMLSTRWMFQRLCHWPWEAVMVDAMRRSWDSLDCRDSEYVISNLSYLLFWDKPENRYYTKWWPVFQEFWANLRLDWKKSIDLDCIVDSLMNDYEALKIVVDDPDLVERRTLSLFYVACVLQDSFYPEASFRLEIDKLIDFFKLTGEGKQIVMNLAKNYDRSLANRTWRLESVIQKGLPD